MSSKSDFLQEAGWLLGLVITDNSMVSGACYCRLGVRVLLIYVVWHCRFYIQSFTQQYTYMHTDNYEALVNEHSDLGKHKVGIIPPGLCQV